MKKVTQTILTAPGGDCFAACLASILERELTEVPNFQGTDWIHQCHAWLRPYGLAMLHTLLPDAEHLRDWPDIMMPGYTILAVDSPRFPGHLHAVVALDGRIVWDPHPDAAPAGEAALVWREVSYFLPLDARQLVQHQKVMLFKAQCAESQFIQERR